jgi:CRISPR-associated protein Cas5d
MRKGQCFHHPYFGCREFPVQFEFIEGDVPRSPLNGNRDLGPMLWDIDFKDDLPGDTNAIFFRASMEDGIIDVQKCLKGGAFS